MIACLYCGKRFRTWEIRLDGPRGNRCEYCEEELNKETPFEYREWKRIKEEFGITTNGN